MCWINIHLWCIFSFICPFSPGMLIFDFPVCVLILMSKLRKFFYVPKNNLTWLSSCCYAPRCTTVTVLVSPPCGMYTQVPWDSKQSHISNKWTLAAGFNWKKNVIPYNPDHFLILNYFLHLCMFQNNLTFWLQIYMNIGDVIATHCHTVGHHYIFGETRERKCSHQPAYWNCVFPSNHMMAVVHWVLSNSALLQRYPDCPPEGLAQHSKHYTSCPLGVHGLQKW